MQREFSMAFLVTFLLLLPWGGAGEAAKKKATRPIPADLEQLDLPTAFVPESGASSFTEGQVRIAFGEVSDSAIVIRGENAGGAPARCELKLAVGRNEASRMSRVAPPTGGAVTVSERKVILECRANGAAELRLPAAELGIQPAADDSAFRTYLIKVAGRNGRMSRNLVPRPRQS